ncbi:MAG TPA: hypothetical protein PLF61_02235 [Candidatus Goldiibacteriota bacterium]|nr:hypothetical protein [Candidatus Goldiibacteriota bacterium]
MQKYSFGLLVFFILLLISCASEKTINADNSVSNAQQEQKAVETETVVNNLPVTVTETVKQELADESDAGQEKQQTEKSVTITAKVLVDAGQKKNVEKESSRFFPAAVGNRWFYQGYWKNDQDKKTVKVKADILNVEKKDGKEYFYYCAPKVDIRYLNRKDETGVYMRVIKFPFPVFSFAMIEVDLEPEMLIIKFPFKVGEKWTAKAKASTTVFGFWKLSRDVQTDFEVVEKVKIQTGVGEIEAYHIKAIIDNSFNVTEENYWYGKDIGYAVGETSAYFVKVHGYIIKDEKTGEIRKIMPPEGDKEYE